MPIEVFAVEGIIIGHDSKQGDRVAEHVADDIKAIYDKVIAKGGNVIATHTLTVNYVYQRDRRGPDCLFLVADLPAEDS